MLGHISIFYSIIFIGRTLKITKQTKMFSLWISVELRKDWNKKWVTAPKVIKKFRNIILAFSKHFSNSLKRVCPWIFPAPFSLIKNSESKLPDKRSWRPYYEREVLFSKISTNDKTLKTKLNSRCEHVTKLEEEKCFIYLKEKSETIYVTIRVGCMR